MRRQLILHDNVESAPLIFRLHKDGHIFAVISLFRKLSCEDASLVFKAYASVVGNDKLCVSLFLDISSGVVFHDPPEVPAEIDLFSGFCFEGKILDERIGFSADFYKMVRQLFKAGLILCRSERYRLSDPVQIHAVHIEAVFIAGGEAHHPAVSQRAVIVVVPCA